MSKIEMFVFNNLSTDARVKRSIDALANENQIKIYSYGSEEKFHIYKKVINISTGSDDKKMNYFKYLFFVVKQLIASKADVFYGHDYYSLPILFILCYLKRKKKIIYDAHELLINDPKIKYTKREMFFIFFEKKIINKVNVIAASEDRAEIMKQYYHLKKMPIVIENISILKNSTQKLDSATLSVIKKFKENSNFLYGYTGVLSKERNILKFVKDIIEKSEDSILVVGKGDQKKEIENLYGDNEKVLLLDTVPYEQLYEIVGYIDAGIIQYPSTNWNNKYFASNKIFEYASRKKPFIFYDNPTLEKMSQKYAFCLKIDNNISELSDIIKDRHQQIQQSINDFLDEHNMAEVHERIRKVIEE
ncbi:hypothetical protein D920_00586 [Enterococcus faecalis 13-SD-W-01]|nr:hypothetical protein D920_00586 [Enterococcus faecalis 13-SD-W-01]